MTGSRSLPLLKVFGIRVGVNYSHHKLRNFPFVER